MHSHLPRPSVSASARQTTPVESVVLFIELRRAFPFNPELMPRIGRRLSFPTYHNAGIVLKLRDDKP